MGTRFLTLFLLSLLIVLLQTSLAYANSITVNTDVVNVREGPGYSFGIIGNVKNNETYSVLESQNGWYKIELKNGTKGWIAGYLTTLDQKQSDFSRQGIIIADHVNVRNIPSEQGDIVGKLNSGDSVKAEQTKNEWVQIEYQNQTAWVNQQFIRLNDQKENVLNNRMAVVLYNNTNIRTEPSTDSAVTAKANAGDRYPINKEVGNWYEIYLSKGQTGYIASWVVAVHQANVSSQSALDPSVLKGKTIVLDPGHGGKDRGTKGASGTMEKILTLETAERLYEKLERAGAHVFLTREDDSYIPLASRVAMSQILGADAFISIHFDSNHNQNIRGFTTYYYHPYQQRLAQAVEMQVKKASPLFSLGVKKGDFYVLRENSQPSVLLELGFLSNPQEEQTIITLPYQEQATTGIYNGLISYFSQ
ncbi:N-acetylmuramoyl-L-alanine amidase [Bacillus sp. FSL W8-1127]|jgi:N-acetylmuramoyl-L-alanine amidase|uniref:N-acetylmuramoyl-L-alanine amidase n=1 Tax=Bacillus sp. FSL W8-1127 TaxID=2954710 RepID=UPI0030FA4C7A